MAEGGGGQISTGFTLQQMEEMALFSNKAKTDAKSRETLQIGKPAGKKQQDDRINEDQMVKLLRQAQRIKTPIGVKNSNALRLNFAQSTIVDYEGHSKVATGIMYNKNARVFTSYNEKGIHVWNPETGKQVLKASFELGMAKVSKQKSFSESSRLISCVCYSPQYHLYFACTKNFQLLVFNEYLNCVEELPLNVRLVQQCLFVDSKQQLITAGVQGCFVIQLDIRYTYEARQAILLNPKGDSISVKLVKVDGRSTFNDYYRFQRIGKWVKGMTLDLKQGYFVCWSDHSTYFYEFSEKAPTIDNVSVAVVFEDLTLGMRSKVVQALDEAGDSEQEEDDDAYLKRIVPRQDADQITDVLLYNPMHYFVVATALGHMLVFKWNFNPVIKQMMHTYKGHSRAVTSMRLIRNSYSSFVSASLDGTVRVWCLDKFIQLYTFQTEQIQSNSLGACVTDIRLLDDTVFAVMSKGPNKVTVGRISHLAKSYFISQPPVTSLSKSFTSVQASYRNRTDSLLAAFDNNSVLLLDPDTGAIKSTIYPPPTPTNISRTIYSLALRRVFVFLQTGTFCVYKVEDRETATLEKLQFPKQLKDYEGKSLTQTITALTLCSLTPPEIDSEIFSETFKYRPDASQTAKTKMQAAQDEDLASDSSSDSQFYRSRRQSSFDQLDAANNGGPSEDDEPFNQELEEEQVDKFLVAGLSKGSVIFVKVTKIEHIYARFSIHKQQIDHIAELKEQKAILTICQENELKFWGFEDGMIQIWRKFNLMRPISALKIVENPTMLLMTFPSGESYYFGWSKKAKNLRIVLPDEGVQSSQEDQAGEDLEDDDLGADEVDEAPKIRQTKRDLLNELLKKGLLMNGNYEHDEEVTTMDAHAGLKLLVSGDTSGLIKVWNFRRQLIREIKFTEAIQAVCFLNESADLVVGHKGKISRIDARDYLPDKSLYALPSLARVKKILRRQTVEIPEDFFLKLKEQNEETALLNERIQKKNKVPTVEKNKALMAHLGQLFKETPKFGMPMEQFKALLQKDERVPKMTDKRKLVSAISAKLANEMASEPGIADKFHSKVFHNALIEAIREQERLNKSRPAKGGINSSPAKGSGTHLAVTSSVSVPAAQRSFKLANNDRTAPISAALSTSQIDATPLSSKHGTARQPGFKNPSSYKRPGSTRAIPFNLGRSKPNHPKIGHLQAAQRGSTTKAAVGGPSKTRHQMTQERIQDNIKFFNDPMPDTQMNILMVGQQLSTMSILSEKRPISRTRVVRSKGTMSSIEAEKAVSELHGQIQHFMSASQSNFTPSAVNQTHPLRSNYPKHSVPNVFSSDHLQDTEKVINPYQIAPNESLANFRRQRKALASANLHGRRYQGVTSAGSDTMSQPDFSMGMTAVDAQSASGPGTAAATDSVRPISYGGSKHLSSVKNSRGPYSRHHNRPGTTGAPGNQLFRRSDFTSAVGGVRSLAGQNSSNTHTALGDEFLMVGDDNQQIKINLNGAPMQRNLMNTSSHENHLASKLQGSMYATGAGDIVIGPRHLTMANSTPSHGFPQRGARMNIKVHDMKKQGRNAAIANIQRQVYISKGKILQGGQQQETQGLQNQQMLMVDTQKASSTEQLFVFADGAPPTEQKPEASEATGSKAGVPSQVIEMNENVRELVITPQMRQSHPAQQLRQSTEIPSKKLQGGSSGLSHLSKGFMGTTPLNINQEAPQTEMSNQQ